MDELIPQEDRVRSNIWLKRTMYDKIEEIASRDGRSISDVVREALRDFILKDGKKFGEVSNAN